MRRNQTPVWDSRYWFTLLLSIWNKLVVAVIGWHRNAKSIWRTDAYHAVLPYTHIVSGSAPWEWTSSMNDFSWNIYVEKFRNAVTSQLVYSHFRLPAKQSLPSCTTSSWLPSAGCYVKASCSISCWYLSLAGSPKSGGSSSFLDGVSARTCAHSTVLESDMNPSGWFVILNWIYLLSAAEHFSSWIFSLSKNLHANSHKLSLKKKRKPVYPFVPQQMSSIQIEYQLE